MNTNDAAQVAGVCRRPLAHAPLHTHTTCCPPPPLLWHQPGIHDGPPLPLFYAPRDVGQAGESRCSCGCSGSSFYYLCIVVLVAHSASIRALAAESMLACSRVSGGVLRLRVVVRRRGCCCSLTDCLFTTGQAQDQQKAVSLRLHATGTSHLCRPRTREHRAARRQCPHWPRLAAHEARVYCLPDRACVRVVRPYVRACARGRVWRRVTSTTTASVQAQTPASSAARARSAKKGTSSRALCAE